jgi:membrane protease YdiL (CAAX protease family)
MVGIIVQLLISWLLIRLFEKGNLDVLGYKPTPARLLHFLLFFTVTALLCASGFVSRIIFFQEQYRLNPGISANLILEGVWWNIKSVLFEELIFRGVLLYILIRKIGATKAIIISAIAFGVYHWFSQEAFGNPQAMVVSFFSTGIMGLVLAFGFAKTKSLYIPVAIHLGWNLTQQFIFSSGPTGNQILIPVPVTEQITVSYVTYFGVLFLPIVATLLVNFLLIRKLPETPFAETEKPISEGGL